MNSKKTLPLQYPPITTFPSYSATLGILSVHRESFDWIYSHYIQLCSIEITNASTAQFKSKYGYIPIFFVDTDSRCLTNIFSDNYFIMRTDCPYLKIFEIPNDLVDSLKETFLTIIKHCINLDMYLYGHLDVSKIEQYGQAVSGFHEVFIYGYDDAEKVILFADFPISENGQYKHSKCTYEEIENAFFSMKTFSYPTTKSIALIQYSDETPFVFDMKYVRDTVRNYLDPSETDAENFNNYALSSLSCFGWQTKTYLGIEMYSFLKNYMKGQSEKDMGLSVELFHGLYDHKNLMMKRVEYFVQKGYLNASKMSLLNELAEVKNKAMALRNRMIKSNIQGKLTEHESVFLLIDQMSELEVAVLKKVFDL